MIHRSFSGSLPKETFMISKGNSIIVYQMSDSVIISCQTGAKKKKKVVKFGLDQLVYVSYTLNSP